MTSHDANRRRGKIPPRLAVMFVGLLSVTACSTQTSPAPTLRTTPTPVPGPTLSPTATRPGTGLGDCGAIPSSDCEAAWAAATDFGLDPKMVPHIVAWQVRPTVVRTCGGDLAPDRIAPGQVAAATGW